MRYKTIYIEDSTGPLGSLSPTWRYLKNVKTNTDYSPAPSISGVGGTGWYKFQFSLQPFDHLIGIIDAGVSVPMAYRYKEIELKWEDFLKDENPTINIGQVYDEDTDSLTFCTSLHICGYLLDNVVSCQIYVYDDNHVEKINIQSATQSNGVFLMTMSSPDLVKNKLYYTRTKIVTLNGETYWSSSSFFALE